MAQSTDDIIVLRDAAIGYDGQPVQQKLTFSIKRGEVFIVAGGSGSGKSTLMDTMIGLIPAIAGSIAIDGTETVGLSDSAYDDLRTRFGVSYQGGALWGSQTVLENVMLPLQTYTTLPDEVIRAAALGKLGLVGMADSAHKLPSEVSGGMAKRAAIARALALDPALVFLDEPSAGLDPITASDLDELLRTLNTSLGTTFVVVSHDLPSIFRIGHRMVVLDRGVGTMVALGAPEELKNSKDPFVHAFMNRETNADLTRMKKEAGAQPATERSR